ncbi:general secretion pathway protein GspD [Croceibacter atlanticus]|uniref:type II secretion system protein GspD n=1 Tax=Croceibacter atlanticus TaxID=313588 RepID=UPI001C602885|nr:general secretion pathway protein GspD [Croceibacter atlanticus]MBW4970782.1 general secretion pathway protein GspD [Croceibacter atlanticus]
MKPFLIIVFLSFSLVSLSQEVNRIQDIKNQLELLSVDNEGFSETLKLEFNINNVTLSNFLIAISRVHNININVSPELSQITLVNNFSNVNVADVLLFLCKEYKLDIVFTGNILSINKYNPPPKITEEKTFDINFDPNDNVLSLDLNGDPLGNVFRKIIDLSGKNLLYTTGMENLPLTMYLNRVTFDKAIQSLALTNNLEYTKSKDGFYLFSQGYNENSESANSTNFNRNRITNQPNFSYQVLDTVKQILRVDFKNAPINDIVNEIALDLNLDIYVATSLYNAGNATIKSKAITFDGLLNNIFESQQTQTSKTISSNDQNSGLSNRNTNQNTQQQSKSFGYKKEGTMYFFGLEDQLSVRNVEVIPLMHRSVELLGDPSRGAGRSAGRTVDGDINYITGQNNGFSNATRNNNINTNQKRFENFDNKAEALISILPDDILANLDVKMDVELNSFLISGPSTAINRFRSFIKEIDKPIPVILIEVMILEINRNATLEAGVSFGIGDEPINTQGSIYPTTDLDLGSNTINRIIGGFDGFINIGQVVPNFFANIKAMEANGNVKIRSTPKLSTLNGHRANLSIGETTYYVVTNQSFFGSQVPQTSQIRNFQPIDAELGVSIKPLVAGDGQITLDIHVIQSDFNNIRITEDAPPGLNSREFSSIVRVRDQDIVVLGGLEEKIKNDSGSGVPFLARIPIIKWLFSKRIRQDSKRKLSILIKPTIIY